MLRQAPSASAAYQLTTLVAYDPISPSRILLQIKRHHPGIVANIHPLITTFQNTPCMTLFDCMYPPRRIIRGVMVYAVDLLSQSSSIYMVRCVSLTLSISNLLFAAISLARLVLTLLLRSYNIYIPCCSGSFRPISRSISHYPTRPDPCDFQHLILLCTERRISCPVLA